MIYGFYDLESNGLLKIAKDGHPALTLLWTGTLIITDEKLNILRNISAADQVPYYAGATGRGWERMPLLEFLAVLATCDVRVGHNIQDFDERAIPMVYPWWKPKPGSTIIDTIIWSRLLYPDMFKSGPNNHKLFGFMKGAHSLKAWGLRLGEHKGDYTGGWMQWSEDMQSYGEQDTIVLFKLFKWLKAQDPARLASWLEHGFAAVIRRQEDRGFCFDHPKALILLGSLTTREQELEASLIDTFGEWWEFGKPANAKAGSGKDGSSFETDEDDEDEEIQEERRQAWLKRQEFANVVIPTASRNVKMLGFPDVTRPRFSATTGKEIKPYVGPPLISYTQGHAYTPIKRVQFNPSSRTHVIKRLIALRGWEPTKFTKGGKFKKGGPPPRPPQPMVDDSVLMALPWPEAQLLAEYYLVLKRIGMLATGKKAWLKVVKEYPQPNGTIVYRIHGRVNTNGAVTGRCTHSDPNLAQVPKNSSGVKEYPDQPYLWGSACRDLFIAGLGYALVGVDGSSLELRMKAHYVYRYDKGAFAKAVDEGKKEDRTDPHSLMCLMIGEEVMGPVSGQGRDNAKTVVYADLYGAGDEKRGSIILPFGTKAEKVAIGKLIGERMQEGDQAGTQLKRAIVEAVDDKGFLLGLDNRVLRIRKAHAALNTLLQSAGAVVMKMALVLLDRALQDAGLIPGKDYEFVANIHDEAQAEVLPIHVPKFKELAIQAVADAGTKLRLKCPLKAEAEHGHSWMHTH